MAFRKSSRNQTFTVIYQEVAQHETMSMEARGLLLYMLSLPEDWEYHRNWLIDQCPGWGRDKVKKVLKELSEKGYLCRTARRSENGSKFDGWDWEVLAESALSSEGRETRPSEVEDQKSVDLQSDGFPDRRLSRPSGNTSDNIKETSLQIKKVSKLTTREADFFDRVLAELHADNLPERKIRYATMKIQEYRERFPESDSVPDCWDYVVQAVKHQITLTGS